MTKPILDRIEIATASIMGKEARPGRLRCTSFPCKPRRPPNNSIIFSTTIIRIGHYSVLSRDTYS
jgi:hypothetical protein